MPITSSHVFEPTPLAATNRRLVAKTISQPMSGKDLSEFLRQLLHTGVAAAQLAHRYSLSTTQEVVIGRDPSCEIVLDSNLYGMVSRRHAAVRPQHPLPDDRRCPSTCISGFFVT